jgi:hypothetical protein
MILLAILILIFVVTYTNNPILIALAVGFLVMLIIVYFSSKNKYLVDIQDANNSTPLNLSQLGGDSNMPNFTHSIWFYISDLSNSGNSTLLSSNPMNVIFSAEGELQIDIYSTTAPAVPVSLTVADYPLQKWTNLIISKWQKTIDIYIDGKLISTQRVHDVQLRSFGDTAVTICPAGNTYSGQYGNYKFISNEITPQEAYNIYKDGAIGNQNIFSELLSKYKLKISYLVDDIEQKSLIL